MRGFMVAVALLTSPALAQEPGGTSLFQFTCTPMPLPNEKASSDPTVRINIRLGARRHIGVR